MINKSKQTLENQLVTRIADLERQVRDIKVSQPVGADVVKVVASATGSISFTVPGNSIWNIAVYAYPHNNLPTLIQPLASFYVDADQSDFTHVLPDGSGLTIGQQNIHIEHWTDAFKSNDVSGQRGFVYRVGNSDTSSHTVYFYFHFYSIEAGATL